MVEEYNVEEITILYPQPLKAKSQSIDSLLQLLPGVLSLLIANG